MTRWTGALGILLFCFAACANVFATDQTQRTVPKLPVEGKLESFLGKPEFKKEVLFKGERFPNVNVALNGTVIATWGRHGFQVRLSKDGGSTWKDMFKVEGPGFHGGGLTVDEKTGDVLGFGQTRHPPSGYGMYRSKDHGETWVREKLDLKKDFKGHIPQVHMAESGITLRHGKYRGRIIRAARWYGTNIRKGDDGYNTAIYSDDGGKTWASSTKHFPSLGTGEGAIAELSNGTLYYSSRKHWFATDETPTYHRAYAYSKDGGETWQELSYAKGIPDGPKHRGPKGRGACYNGHFGLLSGLVRLPVKGKDILIYSSADHPVSRTRLTVWGSFDGGGTWPVRRIVIPEGHSAYSSLSAGRPQTSSEGWIYLLFEGKGTGEIARFNLSWLLDGEKTGNGKLPTWIGKKQ
jgi:sialidase-1